MHNDARHLHGPAAHAAAWATGWIRLAAPAALWSGMTSGSLPADIVDAESDALERCRALGLNPARLRFYRWLVQTGRLHD